MVFIGQFPRKFIKIQQGDWSQIIAHLNSTPQNEEACGLIGGSAHLSMAIYPIKNILHSPIRFLMSPSEQLAAFLDIDKKGWILTAIYHTHPLGLAFPSEIDIKELNYPEAIQIILTPHAHSWQASGFIIQNQSIKRVQVITD